MGPSTGSCPDLALLHSYSSHICNVMSLSWTRGNIGGELQRRDDDAFISGIRRYLWDTAPILLFLAFKEHSSCVFQVSRVFN